MALSLDLIAGHAFSIAHPQCSKQTQWKKKHAFEKKCSGFLLLNQETWRRAHREVHRFQFFDGKQEHARLFSCTSCDGWCNGRMKPWMTCPMPSTTKKTYMVETKSLWNYHQVTSFLLWGFSLTSSTKCVMSPNMHRSGKLEATNLSGSTTVKKKDLLFSWNPRNFRECFAISHARPILQSRSKPNLR